MAPEYDGSRAPRNVPRANVGAFLALTLLCAPTAWAQGSGASLGDSGTAPNSPAQARLADSSPDSVDSTKIAKAFSAFGQNLSSPELPPTLPATPHRLFLMHQYMQAANMPEAAKAFGRLGYDQAKAQFMGTIKALPANRQAIVLAAFDKAFEAADTRRQQKTMAAMADYYATRMTDEELAAVVGFYSQGLGFKIFHDGQHLTPEERQQNGRYMLEHPALTKFAKLNFDYMKHVLATRPADTAAFQADFRVSLCRNLAAARLQSAACLAAHA